MPAQTNALTRKLGPLPVYAWALLIVGAYFLYVNVRGPASAQAGVDTGAGTPASVSSTPSAPASGGGDAGSNMGADLLSALQGLEAQQAGYFDQFGRQLSYYGSGYGGEGYYAGDTSTSDAAGPYYSTPTMNNYPAAVAAFSPTTAPANNYPAAVAAFTTTPTYKPPSLPPTGGAVAA